eukprot:TRINITY_DN111215_c0_g1_i1.p1 TRINITY_DN111215_c0_g1~~TRINITY_DN111215_c0_g1_i1.p1  ORF type:complete len:574 (-),score=138.62 TRINITY_DN111215_c0_g1_i1:145-1866(-)
MVLDQSDWGPLRRQPEAHRGKSAWTVSYKDAAQQLVRRKKAQQQAEEHQRWMNERWLDEHGGRSLPSSPVPDRSAVASPVSTTAESPQQTKAATDELAWTARAPAAACSRACQAFLEKFNKAHADAQRIREGCKAAMLQSRSRGITPIPIVDGFADRISDAKEAAAVSRSASRAEERGLDCNYLPGDHSHLKLPEAAYQDPGAPELLWAELSRLKTAPLALPGSLEVAGEAAALADVAGLRQDSGSPAPDPGFAVELPMRHQPTEPASIEQCSAPAVPEAAPMTTSDGVGTLMKPLQTGMADAGSPARSKGSASWGEDLLEGHSDSDSGGSEDDDVWPPKPPMMRFAAQQAFSKPFRGSNLETFQAVTEAVHGAVKLTEDQKFLQDPNVCWFNQRFVADIRTEFQFKMGFPVMLLTMLDAVYPGKVPWTRVSWRFNYVSAVAKNFGVVFKCWEEVGMNKARHFRAADASLRLENVVEASLPDKLAFLSIMKRWFDSRIHDAPRRFEPISRRHEIYNACLLKGFVVEYPVWMPFDKHATYRPAVAEDPARAAFEKMPECRRLAWFLGTPDIDAL